MGNGFQHMAKFRLDYLDPEVSNSELVELISRVSTALMGKPLIFTFRSKSEVVKRELADASVSLASREVLAEVWIEGASRKGDIPFNNCGQDHQV